jgi:DNA polymerase-1
MWNRAIVINADDAAIFKHLAERKALHVHQTYHAKLPNLKPRSKQAELAAKQKGYVRNLQGRHRHIEPGREHISFNTVNQSTAADIVKERMVALDKWLADTPAQIVAQVHDEILLICPTDYLMKTPTLLPNIVKILAESPAPLSIPLRWCIGASAESWADAAGQDIKIDYESCLA